MKMKKISAMLLALMMVLCLTACGNRGADSEEDEPAASAEKEQTDADSQAESPVTDSWEEIPAAEQSDTDNPVRTLHLLSGEALQWGEDEIDGEYVCLGSFRVPLISLADDEKELYPGLQSALEDLAAEQKARLTYDNILRLVDDPDVCAPIQFLREREIVHFQRFGEALRIVQDKLDSKNFYAFNPEFDCSK